ncbi:hypothetical protein HMPREF0880_03043 [Yokenella regensburgei ATCC 43003]|nr:hypothetical protein HMPREF0880_03043 [Yokenella regensburgei ATCC 43003]
MIYITRQHYFITIVIINKLSIIFMRICFYFFMQNSAGDC